MKKSSHSIVPPTHQQDATLSQANPVSGTQYEVLATTANVRIIDILVSVTWTVQPTPLEVHITIDGRTLTLLVANPTTGTPYSPSFLNIANEQGGLSATLGLTTRPFFLEGRSVRITAETTGGTVSNLTCRVKYARW